MTAKAARPTDILPREAGDGCSAVDFIDLLHEPSIKEKLSSKSLCAIVSIQAKGMNGTGLGSSAAKSSGFFLILEEENL